MDLNSFDIRLLNQSYVILMNNSPFLKMKEGCCFNIFYNKCHKCQLSPFHKHEIVNLGYAMIYPDPSRNFFAII